MLKRERHSHDRMEGAQPTNGAVHRRRRPTGAAVDYAAGKNRARQLPVEGLRHAKWRRRSKPPSSRCPPLPTYLWNAAFQDSRSHDFAIKVPEHLRRSATLPRAPMPSRIRCANLGLDVEMLDAQRAGVRRLQPFRRHRRSACAPTNLRADLVAANNRLLDYAAAWRHRWSVQDQRPQVVGRAQARAVSEPTIGIGSARHRRQLPR